MNGRKSKVFRKRALRLSTGNPYAQLTERSWLPVIPHTEVPRRNVRGTTRYWLKLLKKSGLR